MKKEEKIGLSQTQINQILLENQSLKEVQILQNEAVFRHQLLLAIDRNTEELRRLVEVSSGTEEESEPEEEEEDEEDEDDVPEPEDEDEEDNRAIKKESNVYIPKSKR